MNKIVGSKWRALSGDERKVSMGLVKLILNTFTATDE